MPVSFPRLYVISRTSPSLYELISSTTFSHVPVFSPLISMIVSPAMSPALSAGDPGTTESSELVTTPAMQSDMVTASTAIMTFIVTPASSMAIFCRFVLLEYEVGLSTASSSPSMAQYPPSGSSLREYWVSPFCFLNISGPIPTENSFIFTPHHLATVMWPHSCGITSTSSITRNRIAVFTISYLLYTFRIPVRAQIA